MRGITLTLILMRIGHRCSFRGITLVSCFICPGFKLTPKQDCSYRQCKPERARRDTLLTINSHAVRTVAITADSL